MDISRSKPIRYLFFNLNSKCFLISKKAAYLHYHETFHLSMKWWLLDLSAPLSSREGENILSSDHKSLKVISPSVSI